MVNAFASWASSNLVKPFVIVGTGVINPIIGNIIDGCNVDDPHPSFWAPRSLENWSLVRKPQWLSENISYEDGKEILLSTAAVELSFLPTKFSSPDIVKNTIKNDVVADKLWGFGLKKCFKYGIEELLDQGSQPESGSTGSSNTNKPLVFKSSNSGSSSELKAG